MFLLAHSNLEPLKTGPTCMLGSMFIDLMCCSSAHSGLRLLDSNMGGETYWHFMGESRREYIGKGVQESLFLSPRGSLSTCKLRILRVLAGFLWAGIVWCRGSCCQWHPAAHSAVVPVETSKFGDSSKKRMEKEMQAGDLRAVRLDKGCQKGGDLFRGSQRNKDYNIWGSLSGNPHFRKLPNTS